jgi:hypothetical protein
VTPALNLAYVRVRLREWGLHLAGILSACTPRFTPVTSAFALRRAASRPARAYDSLYVSSAGRTAVNGGPSPSQPNGAIRDPAVCRVRRILDLDPMPASTRVNVVLYREPWGQTPWTRVEETAVKEACLNRGWSSLFFIVLDRQASFRSGSPTPTFASILMTLVLSKRSVPSKLAPKKQADRSSAPAPPLTLREFTERPSSLPTASGYSGTSNGS